LVPNRPVSKELLNNLVLEAENVPIVGRD